MSATKKEAESYYFHKFRRNYELPEGIIEHKDAPDFRIVRGGHNVLGVEVTNFHIDDGSLFACEQQQDPLRQQVVKLARIQYEAAGGSSAWVTVGFNKAHPITDFNQTGRRLKDLVLSELSKSPSNMLSGQIRLDRSRAIPEISYVSVSTHDLKYASEWEHDENEDFSAFRVRRNQREIEARQAGIYERVTDADWRVCQVHRGRLLPIDRLKQIVKTKEEKARKYERCDAYYLLIIVDFADPAQDVELPPTCRLESDRFERILIFRTAFDRILVVKGPENDSREATHEI